MQYDYILCERNFEYFSEDPILAGRMAAAYVRGVEKKHVCSCVKHFAANNADVDLINRPVPALAEKCESNRKVRKSVLSDEERRKISLKAAEEGIVLLKNDGILPVSDGGYSRFNKRQMDVSRAF